MIVHVGQVSEGEIRVGSAVHLAIDSQFRTAVRANHSATHLLHAALRQRLGEHVTQRDPSSVPTDFVFDISYPQAISKDELMQIEQDVNTAIRANVEVTTRMTDPESAIQSGAMALFGEKYGDAVRVVQMGPVSTELCGGTHVTRTGDIGLFRIISESAVGSGIRRIEACTGQTALEWTQSHEKQLYGAAGELQVAVDHLVDHTGTMVADYRSLEKSVRISSANSLLPVERAIKNRKKSAIFPLSPAFWREFPGRILRASLMT